MKLTKAQREWLSHAASYAGGAPIRARAISRHVAPIRRLLRRGLVTRFPHPNPKHRSQFMLLRLTEAGRL